MSELDKVEVYGNAVVVPGPGIVVRAAYISGNSIANKNLEISIRILSNNTNKTLFTPTCATPSFSQAAHVLLWLAKYAPIWAWLRLVLSWVSSQM